MFVIFGRRGSVASSEVCSSGVASSNCYYELFSGTTTGIQLILAGCRKLFPLNLGGLRVANYYFIFLVEIDERIIISKIYLRND